MSIPVTVLTGFLGSGKTTLLNGLLSAPEMAGTGVLVNELGTTGIDHELIIGGSDDMLMLSGGCLCCQPRGSIADALARLAAVPDTPRRVIVETSGAANPVPILETLALTPALRSQFHLASVVTVVEAGYGAENLRRHEEARLQLACADHVAITKSDISDGDGTQEDLRRVLDAEAHSARRHVATAGQIPAALRGAFVSATDPSRFTSDGAPPHLRHAHEPGYDTVTCTFDGALDPDTVHGWIEDLLTAYGSHLLRLKGVLQLHGYDQHGVLQCVRDVLHPLSWTDAASGNRLVATSTGIHPELIQDAFDWLAGQARQ